MRWKGPLLTRVKWNWARSLGKRHLAFWANNGLNVSRQQRQWRHENVGIVEATRRKGKAITIKSSYSRIVANVKNSKLSCPALPTWIIPITLLHINKWCTHKGIYWSIVKISTDQHLSRAGVPANAMHNGFTAGIISINQANKYSWKLTNYREWKVLYSGLA